MRRGILAAVAASAFGWIVLTPGLAGASCVQLGPLEEEISRADTVFVGTVTSVSNEARWAVFRVEEIWKGEELPTTVTVKGGPEGNVATSVDRSYEVGTRYLVVPLGSAGPVMEDNACSATQPYTAELDALRPADARMVGGGDGPTAGVDQPRPVLALVAAAGAALAAAGTIALFMRRRATRPAGLA